MRFLNLLQKEEWKGISTTILTPYTAHRDYMNKRNTLENVKIYTIDSFQGREDDAVILSCVRTDKIGFIQELARMNVVLTRGKRIFWIIGNIKILAKNDHCKPIQEQTKVGRMGPGAKDLGLMGPGLIIGPWVHGPDSQYHGPKIVIFLSMLMGKLWKYVTTKPQE